MKQEKKLNPVLSTKYFRKRTQIIRLLETKGFHSERHDSEFIAEAILSKIGLHKPKKPITRHEFFTN